MAGLLTFVVIGFLLGMRHATDPDHVVAVSTIVSGEHDIKRSAWIGMAWGIGHTLTILAVGGAIIVFRITVAPRVGLAMELAVALMLIVLGLKNVGATFAIRPANSQPTADPTHGHSHHLPALDHWFHQFTSYQMVRPLIVGIVHGLAGSAAIALLVLSTISNLTWSIAYLAVFGVGTILGMMLITLTIGTTFAYGQKRFASVGRHFRLAAGLISLAFGVFIAYQIGFVNGLFTGNVTWVPR